MKEKGPEDFADDFLEDLNDRVEEGGATTMEEALTQEAIQYMEEEGLIEAMDHAYLKLETTRPHRRLNAWGISDDGQNLVVLVCRLFNEPKHYKLYKDEGLKLLRQAEAVARDALTGRHKDWGVKQSQEAFKAAESIHEVADQITRVDIVVATNVVMARDWPLEMYKEDDRAWHPRVIDLERFWRFRGGEDPERIQLELDSSGRRIPVVKADAAYPVYLGMVSGTLLADIYERYGTQLMESNVRAFLQARGNVNKGIKTTIIHEPEMFLTYNNGIACTATHVSLDEDERTITGIDDLQIVNGGQTTASIYHARLKDKADVSKILVPMKLTVIENKDEADGIVPNISRFSNTQNQVNLADFASNDPFHVAMFQASQAVSVPGPSGGKMDTYWFYERTRGLFDEHRARARTPAKRRLFNQKYPGKQRIQKAHLAKALNAWAQMPREVALGLQKNFNEFSIRITNNPPVVTENFFRESIAKWVLFKRTDLLISRNLGGAFKAPILAYTVSWFSRYVNGELPWTLIWRDSEIPEMMEVELVRLATIIEGHIAEPSHSSIKNPGEWAKKRECWEELLKMDAQPSAEFLAGYKALCDQNRPTKKPRNFSEEDITIPGRVFVDLARWLRQRGEHDARAVRDVRTHGQQLAKGAAPKAMSAGAAGRLLLDALDQGFKTSHLSKRGELEIRRRFE